MWNQHFAMPLHLLLHIPYSDITNTNKLCSFFFLYYHNLQWNPSVRRSHEHISLIQDAMIGLNHSQNGEVLLPHSCSRNRRPQRFTNKCHNHLLDCTFQTLNLHLDSKNRLIRTDTQVVDGSRKCLDRKVHRLVFIIFCHSVATKVSFQSLKLPFFRAELLSIYRNARLDHYRFVCVPFCLLYEAMATPVR